MRPLEAARTLSKRCRELGFQDPVAWTYDPLHYAWDGHRQYVERYGDAPKAALLVGMNPGPWGMGQTGVPFGDPDVVRERMGIEAIDVHPPEDEREDRPVYGIESPRNEVSGTRLYEGLAEAFGTLDAAYERVFVANYCPLLFFDEEASNVTPPKLRKADREALFESCDEHLDALLDHFDPDHVVGVGRFAEERAEAVLDERGDDTPLHYLMHPSPANPHANKDGGDAWRRALREALAGCDLAEA